MKIAVMSDTHNRHVEVDVPDADVVIHCGDFTMLGQTAEIISFANWFAGLPHKHKIVVAGNHDRQFEHNAGMAERWLDLASEDRENPIHYLRDSEIVLEGVKFYGTPWTPRFGGWSFMLDADGLAEKALRIPDDVEVLITHGPPKDILDLSPYDNEHAGDTALLARVIQLRQLKLHCFGHIHDASGTARMASLRSNLPVMQETWFCNAAICDEDYEPTNPVRVFEV